MPPPLSPAFRAQHRQVREDPSLSVRLACTRDAVTLEVTDDGVGFDATLTPPGHLGLRSMQERARQIGAVWELESTAGHGTRVTVRVPVGQPAEA